MADALSRCGVVLVYIARGTTATKERHSTAILSAPENVSVEGQACLSRRWLKDKSERAKELRREGLEPTWDDLQLRKDFIAYDKP